MVNQHAKLRWRPGITHVVAGLMVLAGFLLLNVSWWFFLLVGLGTFGPGLLRELGLLQDRDEFQRRADQRAAYHSFLATGLLATLFIAFFRSGGTIEHTERLATLFLVVLWFTWFISSLLSFWGPRRTAGRVLIAFGLVWLAFLILSNVGEEWTGWPAMLLQPLLALPFFVLAWMSGRWPRIAGVLLVGASIGFFLFFFGPSLSGESTLGLLTNAVTFVLFIGPLLASGLALLGMRAEDDDDDDDDESDEVTS